jgi:hypothetical protein
MRPPAARPPRFRRGFRRDRRVRRAHRGSALLLVLALTVGFGTLALGAIYMAGNATLIGRSYDREQDFKYAADAAVAVGKSQLNHDPYALPDSGYVQLVSGGAVDGADGRPVPGLTVNVYAGPSGSTTGQFGRFASVVAEARDVRGARFVRRLELTQESFARFAYWSNTETQPNGNAIFFNGGDVLWGPVWSNDQIRIGDQGGATFNDEVGTALTISGKPNGTFRRGYQENKDRINLPDNPQLDRLPGYATAGGLSFAAPNSGNETQVRMRVEFVAVDLSQPADGDSTDADEGFVRVYTANAAGPDFGSNGAITSAQWLRGDYTAYNCGDWHKNSAGVFVFYPRAVHGDVNYRNTWQSSTARNNTAHHGASLADIMGVATGQSSSSARWMESGAPAPRCFPGGDPHLAPVERSAADWPGSVRNGGSDTTFTRVGRFGTWRSWGGTAYAPLQALADAATPAARRRSAQELATLHPLFRGANQNTKGVVFVDGTAGLSGTLRGKVTVYSNANLILLDDLRYATDPSATDPLRAVGRCADVLGVLARNNVVVANNGLLTPVTATGSPNSRRNADDTKDLFIHAVVMALNTSFVVENYDGGPTTTNGCQGSQTGRGCLFLTGGLIQNRRGAVGTSSGTGFIKRYSYDRCAAVNPPPYFPTTGRFLDNRYYELDPVRFDVGRLFLSLTPNY